MMRMLAIAAGLSLGWCAAVAQDGDMEATFEMVRSFMEAEREVMIEEELRLTDAEAEGFWPIYESYRAEIDALQNRYADMIEEYADNYDALSEGMAQRIVDEYFEIENGLLAVREAYVERFTEVLSIQKLARFYQMENRIDNVADLALMREIPLIDVPGQVTRGRRYAPRNRSELARVIRSAAKAGKKLKAVASGHSHSKISGTSIPIWIPAIEIPRSRVLAMLSPAPRSGSSHRRVEASIHSSSSIGN